MVSLLAEREIPDEWGMILPASCQMERGGGAAFSTCICVFLYLCICVFVYLCLAKWDNLVTTAVHLLVVHFSKCFSPDIIIHSGMLSRLTDKKYISSAVISRGEAAETCKKCKYQILFVIALTIGDPSKQITVVVSN